MDIQKNEEERQLGIMLGIQSWIYFTIGETHSFLFDGNFAVKPAHVLFRVDRYSGYIEQRTGRGWYPALSIDAEGHLS